MTEAIIGGKTFTVGQHVRWLRPDGKKIVVEIVAFRTNTRTNELMAVLDNHFCFGAEDVDKQFVEDCRRCESAAIARRTGALGDVDATL